MERPPRCLPSIDESSARYAPSIGAVWLKTARTEPAFTCIDPLSPLPSRVRHTLSPTSERKTDAFGEDIDQNRGHQSHNRHPQEPNRSVRSRGPRVVIILRWRVHPRRERVIGGEGDHEQHPRSLHIPPARFDGLMGRTTTPFHNWRDWVQSATLKTT